MRPRGAPGQRAAGPAATDDRRPTSTTQTACWLAGWLVCWLAVCLSDWLAGWLRVEGLGFWVVGFGFWQNLGYDDSDSGDDDDDDGNNNNNNNENNDDDDDDDDDNHNSNQNNIHIPNVSTYVCRCLLYD